MPCPTLRSPPPGSDRGAFKHGSNLNGKIRPRRVSSQWKSTIGWQKASGYNKRSRVETAIGHYKAVIGDALRFRKDEHRNTEVAIAVHILNRMLGLGRPISVRIK
jgi:hypothetical protein